jgi:hypothetical protein
MMHRRYKQKESQDWIVRTSRICKLALSHVTRCSLTQTPAFSIDKNLHHLLINLPSFLTLFLLYQSLGDFFRFDLTLACLIKSFV